MPHQGAGNIVYSQGMLFKKEGREKYEQITKIQCDENYNRSLLKCYRKMNEKAKLN